MHAPCGHFLDLEIFHELLECGLFANIVEVRVLFQACRRQGSPWRQLPAAATSLPLPSPKGATPGYSFKDSLDAGIEPPKIKLESAPAQ